MLNEFVEFHDWFVNSVGHIDSIDLEIGFLDEKAHPNTALQSKIRRLSPFNPRSNRMDRCIKFVACRGQPLTGGTYMQSDVLPIGNGRFMAIIIICFDDDGFSEKSVSVLGSREWQL